MSLRVLKPGVLDTIQDQGRYGYGHLGINPSGAMDQTALAVANFLVGNPAETAAVEMHFPAPVLRLEADAMISLCGADFGAQVDACPIPVHTPVLLRAGVQLNFRRLGFGARCYLALHGGFELKPWLGSHSTNLAARAGGFAGRALQEGDVISFRQKTDYGEVLKNQKFKVFSWQANVSDFYPSARAVRFYPGAEYQYLDKGSQAQLEQTDWKITVQSNRMGYRVDGPALLLRQSQEMVSSAVCPGTLQLLPSGRFIVLMADGQTTGGYPRIGHVIQADLPRLAQLRPGQDFRLQQVSLETAFAAFRAQQQLLAKLRIGCILRSGISKPSKLSKPY